MSIEIRSILPLEYEEAKRMWDVCFPGDENGFSDHYFSKRTNPENVLALFEDGVMKASLHILRQTACFFDTPKEIGFVAGVATLPLYRRKGFANMLLREAFRVMRRTGLCAAMLQPFSHDFYRKTGFETFVTRKIYALDKSDRHKYKKAYLQEPSAQRMLDIYEKFMQRFSGYRKRDIKDFELLLDEIACTRGLAVQSGEAYAFCETDGNTAVVTETAGENLTSLMAALLFMGFDAVKFPLPENLIIPDLDFAPEPFNMLRILDAEGFLQGLPAENGEFVFSIIDGEIEENCGRFRLTAAGNTVQKIEKISAKIKGDTAEISELMLAACGIAKPSQHLYSGHVFSGKAVNYAFERY
ncbi:MAG: Acetyltransferase (GNAT) family protein [Firmicutes bacterium ADurb.Bin182]|nr:MAG: Acetyltransferase (GNAT) family protein [Firmicutes bacterium ADurb.Bin182]